MWITLKSTIATRASNLTSIEQLDDDKAAFMSKELVGWLVKQISVDRKNLDQDGRRRSPLQNKGWNHPTLVVEGVVYRQLDVKREQAELDAKKQIVSEYRKLLATSSRQQAAEHSQKVEVWEHVLKCLAVAYAGRVGYKASWRP